jgi:ABC-type multidrug transport system fused ATPase/permease subunit
MATLPVTPGPTTAPEPAPLSQAARIVNTFIAPSKTFNDLRRNASWWAPWLLSSIVALVFVYAMDHQIGFEQISKNQVAHSSRAEQFEKLPPDQRAHQIQLSASIVRYASYGAPLLNIIFMVIMAGVLLAVFKFGANAGVTFKIALAIVFYGTLPYTISSLLGIVSMYAGVDPEGFNPQNPVATNPAYFMDLSGNKFLYGMASALDVFVIWSIVLMGIGFSCNSKVKRGTAIALIAGLYFVYKLVASGLASLG